MKTEISIDWITATRKILVSDETYESLEGSDWAYDCVSALFEDFPEFCSFYRDDGPVLDSRYPMQFRCVFSGLVLAAPWRWTPDCVVKLTVSGSVTGIDREDLLTNLQHDWNITRLDVAVDVYEGVYEVKDYIKAYEKHREQTGDRRKYQTIISPGGDTLMIGSRTSNHYIRVYDKAAEQKILGTTWVRLEVEIKGKAAREWARAIHVNMLSTMAANIRKVVGVETYAFAFLWKRLKGAGRAPYNLAVGRKQTNTEKWLKTEVSQAFAKLTVRDLAAAREVMENWRLILADREYTVENNLDIPF